MISKSIAHKAYLIITFVITLPLCIAFYHFSDQQKKIVLMENEREIARISVTLAQKLPQNGKPLVYWRDSFIRDRSFSKNISDINAYYQSFVDEMASMHPYYRIGIYHRNLDSIIAMHPYTQPEKFISLDGPAVREMYNTGQTVVSVEDSEYDGTPVLVAISPIYHLGTVAGFTWVSKRIDNVLSESSNFFIKGIIISLLVWVVLMLVVWVVFRKLDNLLIRFANQITGKELPTAEFEDFPQLEPLFDTVLSLREQLKKETEHYQEESQTLKKLIELTPLAIFVVDRKGIVKNCNQAFLSYHPTFNRETVVNHPYKLLTDSTNREFESTVIIRALRGEEIHDEYDFFLNRCWISSAFPLKANEGEITGAIAVCHDVTEHEKLRKDMIRLDRLNIVGQMAASVAHEVRNPMTVIRGYIQSIARKTGGAYSSQFDTIIEELDRANRIISDFLSLARDKYVEKKKESLSKIVKDIIPLVESEALARHISCHIQLDEELPVLLLNSEEIKQLILNLSMNALDALDEGGLTISCTYNNQTSEVELEVSDTGCGMDLSDIEKVFEPFYTTKKNGSGLGLSICKSIVERHGGCISVQSEKGKGTVFVIRFPVN
ncbi:two-component system sensor histidine kinase NtrB [Sporomusa malonica]|uniref:histidine kinase n=1 Tax=Sporomusa malonica TaxID=112901 RepID=A0A1W2D7U7_9FIRM|nr:ATP-binding protein [Sporomusa malonica]SMC93503.1 PAS domain S-box-containing protein [Sporomusa malonica]